MPPRVTLVSSEGVVKGLTKGVAVVDGRGEGSKCLAAEEASHESTIAHCRPRDSR